MTFGLPPRQGLYDPRHEHDACGIGFVANILGRSSHKIVEQGVEALVNLTHRGACGCDPDTGDGAGLLMQIPHDFFAGLAPSMGFALPRVGAYGVGMLFVDPRPARDRQTREMVEEVVREEGFRVLAWRRVPTNSSAIGWLARESEPSVYQVFLEPFQAGMEGTALERKLFVARKRTEQEARKRQLERYYPVTMSARTICYKGLLLAPQIISYYPDLGDSDFTSAVALIHQRFSTNTFPTWERAHPFRYLAHNGEINTLRGNANWMRAREATLESELFGADAEKIKPIIDETGSDSTQIDNALELLIQSGRSISHSFMMLIPEAWSSHALMEPYKKEFYEYHATMMEPWDGPASIVFTDGRYVGGSLDRNGLRPSRYCVTYDGLVVMGSETGVVSGIKPADVRMKGRLQPGRMFLVDMQEGRIIHDREIKETISRAQPYGRWLSENLVSLDDLPEAGPAPEIGDGELLSLLRAFGYTLEHQRLLLAPMATKGEEPTGSMGIDIPLACLSEQPQLLFNYFKQLFAQVTNPAIDPIREELVMSTLTYVGPQGNVLTETPEHAHQIKLPGPMLDNSQLARLRNPGPQVRFGSRTLCTTFEAGQGPAAMQTALDRLCADAEAAADAGIGVLILSDRGVSRRRAPIPSLLACAAVHHHLIRQAKRSKVGIVVESGEPREVMHFCLLVGYGANAVNPYLAYASIAQMHAEGILGHPELGLDAAWHKFEKAIRKGFLKVMSKMGISTVQSYHGAQIFEAIGLAREVVDRYFTGTASQVEGVGLETLAGEALAKHGHAYAEESASQTELPVGGEYQYRLRGEKHLINPDTVARLQNAVRLNHWGTYEDYSRTVHDLSRQLCTLRGLFHLKEADEPLPLEDVEPASEIVKRFCTGAMSFGSISAEAHETLAMAMNSIGGRSNTGEGGEDPARFHDNRRSKIKQVASGRFGVTANYLANADELQIKIAQGAKPGEGGQLPGHKVDETIAWLRHSTPGVGLISPPPHHDIYSIEDLAQLIFDLKNSNRNADVSVKLVSEVGVGTVAAGVSKGRADLVLISGHDGGTGASPVSSIRHAGTPWELGLSETQQVLVMNDLRGRIRVQVDGKLQTGRDVVVGALLGADEFGFSTMPLIAIGCIMMRKCHLNTCPVGIATQDKQLRKKFAGTPEHVVNFFFMVAEEVRQIMAKMGFRKVDEMIGKVDRLDVREAVDHFKTKGLDFSRVFFDPPVDRAISRYHTDRQEHGLESQIDNQLIELCRPAIEDLSPVEFAYDLRNTDRTVGTMLSHEIAARYGEQGLPDSTVKIHFSGSAGQSFGAWASAGLTLQVRGDANDYFGKGLSGGRLVISPPPGSTFVFEENIIIGNVSFYGATGGEGFVNGMAGERFCIRNSGATVVVEGVGDHGCEYMTNGHAVILGRCGRNFGAGMSGGIAYVLDEQGDFETRCLEDAEVDIDPLDSADRDFIRDLLQRHVTYTRSPKGQWVLEHWDSMSGLFKKVFPRELRRAIREREAREAAKA